jgi:hypothetical protein
MAFTSIAVWQHASFARQIACPVTRISVQNATLDFTQAEKIASHVKLAVIAQMEH